MSIALGPVVLGPVGLAFSTFESLAFGAFGFDCVGFVGRWSIAQFFLLLQQNLFLNN